jgi:hypothetical protein
MSCHDNARTTTQQRQRIRQRRPPIAYRPRRWLDQGDWLTILGRCLVCLSFV